MTCQHLSKVLLSALSLMMVCLCTTATADDTEIFFSRAGSSTDNAPNVLFVLDTSGSMGATDGGTTSRLTRMKTAMRSILSQSTGVNVGLMRYNGVYGGGPVLYPVTAIDEIICDDGSCVDTSQASSIESDWNDVEESLDDNSVDGTGLTLSLGAASNGTSQAVGLRFAGVNIPRGATVLSAALVFTAQRTSSGSAAFKIRSEGSSDAVEFDDTSSSVSSRNWNTPSVNWSPANWFNNSVYESTELKTIVQSVVDRADWCGGSALAFELRGSGNRSAFSKESSDATDNNVEPRLRLTYDASTVSPFGGCGVEFLSRAVSQGNDDAEQRLSNGSVNINSVELDMPQDGGIEQKVGVRFQNIDIPAGAIIESASIEFEVRSFRTGRADLTISADADDAAPAYSGNNNNIGSRGQTSETIQWTNLPSASVGSKVETPELKDIIQEVVDRAGWSAGNPLAFTFERLSGASRRSFKSYNQSAAAAPTLSITFQGTVSSVSASLGSSSGGTDSDPATGTGSGIVTGQPIISPPGTATARDQMLEIVDNLTATGGTPTVDSYYEAARYFRGEPVDFGTVRGQSSNQQKRQNFRVSHPDSYSGGRLVRASGCTDANLSSSDCTNETIADSPVYVSPINNSCQANHIVLLSDGETDRNDVTGRIRALTGDSSCSDSGDEACATELASWLKRTDHSRSVQETQDITTHTIAFNLAGSGKQFLNRVAVAGGGEAYEADTADQLVDVFGEIFQSVADIDTGFTAPSATVNQFNRLTHRDDVYFAVFKPDESPSWEGNIKRFRVGKDNTGAGDLVIRDFNGNPAIDETTGYFTSTSQSWWQELDNNGQPVSVPDGNEVARGGAAHQQKLTGVAGIGDRRVYTWVGEADNVPSVGVSLADAAQALSEGNTLLSDTIMGISNLRATDSEQDAYRTNLLQWARGVDVLDEDGDGAFNDVRSHMGDPMHSQPAIINYADSSQVDGVKSIVFVATNDGFVHAIDTGNGEEQFSFIPSELLPNLNQIYQDIGSDHPYGLDGPLSIWRTDANANSIVDRGEQALLYIGMRRGGSQYYALDVSDPKAPRLAWAIKGGPGGSPGFHELAQSWSRLSPVQIMLEGNVRDVLLLGGGYDEALDPDDANRSHAQPQANLGRALFIVDALSGELLWSGLGEIGGDETFADMDYSFASNLRAIDVNRDRLVDQIYAADTGGQLWRFDLAQLHQSGDLVQGGVIARISGNNEADRRRFFAEPDVALIDDGGEQFLTVSIGSGWRAHPLDEAIQDRFYVFRQYSVRGAPSVYGKEAGRAGSGVSTPLTESDLIPISGELNPSVNANGWYLDLAAMGEKVLGAAVTFDNSVVFSTYIPSISASACSAAIGSARAYVLDVANGAPSWDLDKDNDIDLDDMSIELKHGGIPPEAVIFITEDGATSGGGTEGKLFIGPQAIDRNLGIETQRTFWADRGAVVF